jgi:hypothetical protein
VGRLTDEAIEVYLTTCKSVIEACSKEPIDKNMAINELLRAGLVMHESILPEELHQDRILMKNEILRVFEEEAEKSEIEIQPD